MLGIVIMLGVTSCIKEEIIAPPDKELSNYADTITGNWTATTIGYITGIKSLSGGLVPSDTFVYHKDSVTITKINDSTVRLANTSVNSYFKALSDYIDTFKFMGTNIVLTADDLKRYYNDSTNQVAIPLTQQTIGAPFPTGLNTKDSVLGVLYIKCTNLQSIFWNRSLFTFRADFSLYIKLEQLITGGTRTVGGVMYPIYPGSWANPNLAALFVAVQQANPTKMGLGSAMLIGGGVYTTTYQRR